MLSLAINCICQKKSALKFGKPKRRLFRLAISAWKWNDLKPLTSKHLFKSGFFVRPIINSVFKARFLAGYRSVRTRTKRANLGFPLWFFPEYW
jgi:hypothetical protein